MEKKFIEFQAKAVGVEVRLVEGLKFVAEFQKYKATEKQFEIIKGDSYIEVKQPLSEKKKEVKKPKESNKKK